MSGWGAGKVGDRSGLQSWRAVEKKSLGGCQMEIASLVCVVLASRAELSLWAPAAWLPFVV